MRRFFAISLLSFGWLCANGALLDAMQALAWVRMFAGYAETMTVAEALRETFDPEKPCEMCRCVAKAKEAHQKQLPAAPEQAEGKFVLALHPVDAPVFTGNPGRWPATSSLIAGARIDPVPVPPPRA